MKRAAARAAAPSSAFVERLGLALRRLFPRADGFEVLPLFDRRAQELADPLGIGLRAALELRGRSADEPACGAVATTVEARVAMGAMHLERPVRLEEVHDLGLRDERPRVDGHQYASTTDFFSR